MVVLLDEGPYLVHKGVGVATLSLSPLSDRAAIVTSIRIANASAADTWRVKTANAEVGAFRVDTVGNNQPLGRAGTTAGSPLDFFRIGKQVYGATPSYPVPNGMTLIIASDGGATADIEMIYEEVSIGDIHPSMLNHPRGSRFYTLVSGVVGAAVAAAGERAIDTQYGMAWIPNMFASGANGYPNGYITRIMGMLLDGAGVNTFAGGANHQSLSDYLTLTKDGRLFFTRDASGGLPIRGVPSAAGSINTVYGNESILFPPFNNTSSEPVNKFDPPLTYKAGENFTWKLNVAGDVTGGADYSHLLISFLVELTQHSQGQGNA